MDSDSDDNDRSGDQVPVPPTPRVDRRHEDMVPPTPAQGINASVPDTPWTPLSQNNDQPPPTAQEEPMDEEPPVPAVVQDPTTHIRGTDVNVHAAAAAFTDFLRNFRTLSVNDDDDDSMDEPELPPPFYLSRLESLLAGASTMTTTTASLDLDTRHLYYHSPACQRLYHQLVAFPMEIVPLMDIIVQRELERLSGANVDDTTDLPRIQVRPYHLKQVSQVRALDPVAMDSLLAIQGMVVRASPLIPDLKVAHFACVVCGHTIRLAVDRGRVREPTGRCPDCHAKAEAFLLVHNRCVYADKQLVRIQETPDTVPAGQTPASVVTFTYDDLVDTVQPGDKVEITGVLRAQVKSYGVPCRFTFIPTHS
jgi:DNA replication licensing factor MCM4